MINTIKKLQDFCDKNDCIVTIRNRKVKGFKKSFKWLCKRCCMYFIVDRDFKHNVYRCPFCGHTELKEVALH